MNKDTEKLMSFIDESPSMFHVAENTVKCLKANGFTELREDAVFDLEPHGKYFINKYSSAVIAWQNGSDVRHGFRVIGSHLDSPTFKIKPNPEFVAFCAYVNLNTEGYGGAILSTWFDRPLSVAGRIFVTGENSFSPKQILVDVKEPVLIIPNLSIHMNRDVNDGYKYNKQKDTLPLFSFLGDGDLKQNQFMSFIAGKANVKPEDILSHELFLYETTPSTFIGPKKEFFSASKIDNLGMAFPSLTALTQAKKSEVGKMICLFNNEEVGSSTAAGAGSPFFADTLKRIAFSQAQKTKAENSFELFQIMLKNSFLISADQAHAAHPNYAEKNDITCFPVVNGGPAVKSAASMSYTSEGHTVAVFKKLCKDAGVPCQDFVNRSDIRGGSTIGPITMQNLDIRSVDIGNPILGMHSVKELGGCFDQEAITKVFNKFFE